MTRATSFAAKALLARVYLFYSGYYGREDIGITKAEALAGLEDVIASGEFDLLPILKLFGLLQAILPMRETIFLTKRVMPERVTLRWFLHRNLTIRRTTTECLMETDGS